MQTGKNHDRDYEAAHLLRDEAYEGLERAVLDCEAEMGTAITLEWLAEFISEVAQHVENPNDE